jgi:dimethylglycine dehydrogenase
MAMGYLPAELAAGGTEVEVEINGEMYPARVVAEPLYDPGGARMRG